MTKSEYPADLVTFTEEILNGKRHFLYSVWRLFLHYSQELHIQVSKLQSAT